MRRFLHPAAYRTLKSAMQHGKRRLWGNWILKPDSPLDTKQKPKKNKTRKRKCKIGKETQKENTKPYLIYNDDRKI